MPSPTAQELIDLYPAMSELPELVDSLAVMEVPAGTVLFREHETCQGFPMVLEGEVRVSRSSPNGRELELYRVQPGEMCLVSSAGLFAHQPLSAHGVATRATRLTLLSPAPFQDALSNQRFRDFVLGLYAARMADLTGLIEAIAFQKLDARLANTLLGHGQQVRITHQALADELGTVREMVTRLLRRFERDGLVELSRECIDIKNSAALRQVASTRQGEVNTM
ncbi:Crp/Fnr family transcriptional regulator [Hydrogenophaga sp. 5NK40-0174]|uniref:Crp/Fnr family transcriptional regulator n=1 Tax=Hydrogenophaga sp. 5NK40-0174 TaxID=3127649 RepID=UPI003104122F